jgi:hypothetical protein
MTLRMPTIQPAAEHTTMVSAGSTAWLSTSPAKETVNAGKSSWL